MKSKNENNFNTNAALWIGNTGVTNYALLKTHKRRSGIVDKNSSEHNPSISSAGKYKHGKCL